MASGSAFPPAARLHDDRDYGRVFQRQQKSAGPHLVALVRPRPRVGEQPECARLGVMVSTKVAARRSGAISSSAGRESCSAGALPRAGRVGSGGAAAQGSAGGRPCRLRSGGARAGTARAQPPAPAQRWTPRAPWPRWRTRPAWRPPGRFPAPLASLGSSRANPRARADHGVPAVDLAAEAAVLSLSADLLGLCRGRGSDPWRRARAVACRLAHPALPPLGRQRLGPGAASAPAGLCDPLAARTPTRAPTAPTPTPPAEPWAAQRRAGASTTQRSATRSGSAAWIACWRVHASSRSPCAARWWCRMSISPAAGFSSLRSQMPWSPRACAMRSPSGRCIASAERWATSRRRSSARAATSARASPHCIGRRAWPRRSFAGTTSPRW